MIAEMKIALDCHAEILQDSIPKDSHFCDIDIFRAELEKDIELLSKLSVELNYVIRHFKHCLKDFKPTTDIMSPMGLCEEMRTVLLMIGYPTINIDEESIERGKTTETFLPFYMKKPMADENLKIEIVEEEEL